MKNKARKTAKPPYRNYGNPFSNIDLEPSLQFPNVPIVRGIYIIYVDRVE
jgi:hypothetical protein